ncbi:MAG: purine-binding chemotaxis protein CheW [Spirochaetales bacterium]|nr:purine-binding chemotaxis protein CheW [Spirochaetales bacterium]MBR6201033.1 purine-binding chemotaxis protein CheW [Spirochaetales bacterium]
MESQTISLVTFKISNETYAIDIMEVNEIVKLTEITPIPNAPDFVDGIITLRGQIIPIVDLNKRFSFAPRVYTEEDELFRAIVIIRVQDMTIGILIDQVNRVIPVNRDQIQPPPQMISGIGAEFISGVVKQNDNLFVILDIQKLFSKKELMQLSGNF